jgi:hypothetical protein
MKKIQFLNRVPRGHFFDLKITIFYIFIMISTDTIYTSHSMIEEFPPNPKDFPKFYHCEEEIFVLNPGDMLYIPPMWFHWIFSYGENRENFAISYNIYNLENKDVYNEFRLNKPFVFNINIDPFKTFSLNNLESNLQQNIFKTKQSIIVPVNKQSDFSQIEYQKLSYKDILSLHDKKTHNIGICQDQMILEKYYNSMFIPNVIAKSFPKDKINLYAWIYLLKDNKKYVQTGLHYDITHNVLIQVRGTKVVRLYAPKYAKNLYLKPLNKLSES